MTFSLYESIIELQVTNSLEIYLRGTCRTIWYITQINCTGKCKSD